MEWRASSMTHRLRGDPLELLSTSGSVRRAGGRRRARPASVPLRGATGEGGSAAADVGQRQPRGRRRVTQCAVAGVPATVLCSDRWPEFGDQFVLGPPAVTPGSVCEVNRSCFSDVACSIRAECAVYDE